MAHKILLGICSCNRDANKVLRQAIRETWLRRLPSNLAALFFVGRGHLEPASDVIQLPVEDSYETLSLKVQAFFKHALHSCAFDFLFKCDDDTYLVPERLEELAQRGDYVGSAHLASKGFASGGAGYLLSRAAVERIADADPIVTWMEDVWVGDVLKKGGIKLVSTPQLQYNFRRLPRPETNVITAHWCSESVLRSIDQNFSGTCCKLQNGALRAESGSGQPQRLEVRAADGEPSRKVEDTSQWAFVVREAARHLPSWQADSDCGVLTAACAAFFPGFQLLYASLLGRAKIALVDAGLTVEQKDWCAGHAIQIVEPQLIAPRSVPLWQAWNKPAFMQQSPFPVSLWIDADCVVIRSLRPLFEHARRSLFFVRHWSGSNYPRRNAPELLTRFPVAKPLAAEQTINSGVIGYALPRDVEFLRVAESLLQAVAEDPEIRRMVTWQAEGLFHWALAATGRHESLVRQPGWNRPSKIGEDCPIELFANVCTNARADDTILHFTGRKKVWHNWRLDGQML